MESSTLAGNVAIKQLEIQYMKESNSLADNAIIKQHQKEVLLNTKGQYIKKSNTLACNAGNNSLKMEL